MTKPTPRPKITPEETTWVKLAWLRGRSVEQIQRVLPLTVSEITAILNGTNRIGKGS